MVKRNIKPNKILAVAFLGQLAAGAYKIFKYYLKQKKSFDIPSDLY
jgi:hypothetical protein